MIKLGESIITSQGRVSIPKKVRERLHVQKGDKIALFEDEKGRILIREVEMPVTRVHGKAQALKHLDKLRKK